MLRADIDFKVKQFWSNEVNKISAEVYAKDTKKPLVKVSPIVINKAERDCKRNFMYPFI